MTTKHLQPLQVLEHLDKLHAVLVRGQHDLVHDALLLGAHAQAGVTLLLALLNTRGNQLGQRGRLSNEDVIPRDGAPCSAHTAAKRPRQHHTSVTMAPYRPTDMVIPAKNQSG